MYEYSLRYVFDVRHNTEEKNKALLKFVKDAKIDDVCFIINGEELNHSHLTAVETEPWLEEIKTLQKRLAQLGVTTSLNPWTTIMHSDRGFKVNPELGFKTFVDIDGDKAKDMACPADPKWRQYITERYAQYASIHPKRLWLEDDFRHYNHSPLKLMCFCPFHMKLYQEKLGHTESRETFVKALLTPGKPLPERRIYLEQARHEMIETEQLIEQAVHQVSPETDLGQMTSFPDWHAIEGRDWAGLLDAQRGNKTKHPRVVRPHLPAYNEVSPIMYGRNFEKYSAITATYAGNQAELYPELENSMWTRQVKSNNFIAFQIITTALLGAKGILLNIFDMMGNGINENWGYSKMLSDIKPFVNKLSAERLDLETLSGVKVLVDQDSAFNTQTITGKMVEELLPQDKQWASLLGAFGIASAILPVNQQDISNLKNEIIAISGQILRGMDKDLIRTMFNQNKVLLDGDSVQVLIDLGLGKELLHIVGFHWHQCKTGYQSFEQADGHQVDNVLDPRITMLQHTGSYLSLAYEEDADVQVWSSAYNSIDEKLGNMMTIIDNNVIVLPISTDLKYGWEAQYSSYKEGLLKQMLNEVGQVDYLVGMPNVKLRIDHERRIMWLANFTLDQYDEIKWHYTVKPAYEVEVLEYIRGDSQTEKVEVDISGKVAIIKKPLAPLELLKIKF